MVNYGFKVGLDTPNLIEIAQNAKDRDIKQARQNYEDRMKLMQMLGRGVGAYMMNRDYNDWKQADEAGNHQSIVTPEDYQSLYSLGLID